MVRAASLVALLCSLAALAYGQCPYSESGLENWSAAGTWSGGVPGAGSSVTIPAGKKVLLDVSPPQLASITVLGTLIFKDVVLNLNVNWIKVDGGRLAVGSVTCAMNSKIIITLFGARTTGNDIGPDLGAKGIAVLNGGTAEFFGAVSGPSWTRLGATAAGGSSTIVLSEAVQWAIGSQIVITNTDYIGYDYAPEQVENKTITAVSADRKTITLNSPLQWMHWGVAPESAEVGLLTRNIVIQGDASSVASQFGGHIIFYSQAMSGKFRGVEVTRMGQQGVLGRYPIHYHMMQDVAAQNHYVQDCSIHHNLQRCITIHNTNGVTIKDNVAFDTLGHCYFIEDGAEMQNIFDHNLAALARPVPTNPVIPSDTRPACFWITNPVNTYINNAASSCEFGFWFAFPMHPNGKSLNVYSTSLTLWPRFMPILRFDANVAHSHLDSGFFVDQMPDVNGVVDQQEYNPRQGPFTAGDEAPWQYPSITVFYTNCIAYKNRQHGVWTRGDHHVWSGAKLLDNRIGFDSPGGPSVLRDSVIVGESDNIGTVTNPGWLPDYNGRSRPVTWSNEQPIIGWETYDASGPDYAYNVEFVNFVSNSFRKAGAVGLLPNSKNIMLQDFQTAKLRFTNSPGRYWFPNYPIAEELDDPKCSLVFDADGSGTGNPSGAWVHTKQAFLDNGATCTFNTDFNVGICPPFREGYGYMELKNLNTGSTDFAGTNKVATLIRATFYALGDTAGSTKMDIVGSPHDQDTRDTYRALAIMRRGYTIRFLNNHATPPSVQFWADHGLAMGEWVVLAIPYPTSAQPFAVKSGYGQTVCTAVNSLLLLSPTTYFYDTNTEHLYIMLRKDVQDPELFQGLFAVHGGNGIYTSVTASCSGAACKPTKLAIPAALPVLEDVYQANLQPCQSSPPITTSSNVGTAFFSWNPRTLLLSYYIYHSLLGMVTGMHVHAGAVGANGGVEFSLITAGQGGNPIKGAQLLTRDQYLKLIQGNLYVNIHTDAAPGGEIRGQIGCVGSCTPPVPVSTQDPCTPSGSNVIIYQDAILGWPNWRVDNWGGATYSGTNADAPKVCTASTAQVQVSYTSNGAIQFGHSVPQTITQTHLQFYARTTAADPFVLQLTLKRSDSDSGTQLTVGSNFIDNYAITATWTRVRIPLSAFGSGVIQYFVFAQPWSSNPVARDLYLDEIRFVTPGTEPLTAAITPGSIYAYNANICSGPVNPASGNAAANTAATSAAVTSTTAAASNAATVAAAANAAATSNAATSTTAAASNSATSVAAASTAAAASTSNAAATGAAVAASNAATTAAAASTGAVASNAATTSTAANAAASAAATTSAAVSTAASSSASVAATTSAAVVAGSTAAATAAATTSAAVVTGSTAAAITTAAAVTSAAAQAATTTAAAVTGTSSTSTVVASTTRAVTSTNAAATSVGASTSASASTVAASTTNSASASTTSALSAAAIQAASTAAASNTAAAAAASTSTNNAASTVSTTVAASTTAGANSVSTTSAASATTEAASLASVSGSTSTASFAASTTSAASTASQASTAVNAALSTSVTSSTAAVSASNAASATSSAASAIESAITAASSTATSDASVAGTTSTSGQEASTTSQFTSQSETSATSAATSAATLATVEAATSASATSAEAAAATTGNINPDSVSRWVVTLISRSCIPFDVLAQRLADSLGLESTKLILLSYPGCTKRQAEMTFYSSADTDGSIASAVAQYLNTANDPAIVSVSVKSTNSKGASKPHNAPKMWVIAVVISAIIVSLVVLFVLVIVLAVRRSRSMNHTPYHATTTNGDNAVMEGLYQNSGSNRVNNPLLSNYAHMDPSYA